MVETITVKIELTAYELLRKTLLEKNRDIRKGDLLKAFTEAVNDYSQKIARG